MLLSNEPTQSTLKPNFTFSQSSLQDYDDCPRRFQLRFMDELAWPAIEAEPVSEVESRQRDALLFHRMVQQYLQGVPATVLDPMARSADLARWWQNYRAHGPTLGDYAVHTEKTLAAQVGTHRLIAKYDCIAIRNGEAVIYDWKTLARRPREDRLAARWQTRLYRAVLVRSGAELNLGKQFESGSISMVYWLAEFPSEPFVFSYDEPQFKRDWTAVEALVAEITRRREFPLTLDTQQCRYCTYRSLCDRGARPGNWREAENELSEEDVVEPDLPQIGGIGF